MSVLGVVSGQMSEDSFLCLTSRCVNIAKVLMPGWTVPGCLAYNVTYLPMGSELYKYSNFLVLNTTSHGCYQCSGRGGHSLFVQKKVLVLLQLPLGFYQGLADQWLGECWSVTGCMAVKLLRNEKAWEDEINKFNDTLDYVFYLSFFISWKLELIAGHIRHHACLIWGN